MNIQEALAFIEQYRGKYFTIGVVQDDHSNIVVYRKLQFHESPVKFLNNVQNLHPGLPVYIDVFSKNGSSHIKLNRKTFSSQMPASLNGHLSVSGGSDLAVKELLLQFKEEKIAELRKENAGLVAQVERLKKGKSKFKKKFEAKTHEDELQAAKSSGLNGLANSEWVKELVPQVLGLLTAQAGNNQAELSQDLGASLDQETTERIQAISVWFSQQEKPIKDKVWKLLDFLANPNTDTDNHLNQIINLIKDGTTIRSAAG